MAAPFKKRPAADCAPRPLITIFCDNRLLWDQVAEPPLHQVTLFFFIIGVEHKHKINQSIFLHEIYIFLGRKTFF